MDADRLARLTEKQRECLRLVSRHKSSKMIAPLLGITPEAVDQRLKTAVRLLGVASRYEAALLLAEHEGDATYQRTVYDAPDLAASAVPGTVGASAGDRGDRLEEERAAYEPPAPIQPRSSRLPLPMERGRRNDLDLWQRLAWVVAIALGAALSFGAFLAGLRALAQLT
jgi:DNA-binding CsgD family transcriptional regulator